MARRGKGKLRTNQPKLKTETKHGVLAVIFFVLAVFFLLSYPALNKAGVAGEFFYEKFHFLLGVGYILLPVLLFLLGISFVKSETPNIGWTRTISSIMFLLSSLGMIDIASGTPAGGLLGKILSTPLVALFDKYASLIFLAAILIISILIMFDAKLRLPVFLKNIWFKIVKKEAPTFQEEVGVPTSDEDQSVGKEAEEEESTGSKIKKALGMENKNEPIQAGEQEEELPIKKRRSGSSSAYVPPPLSLLEEDKGKPNTGDIKANANIIKRTLANFGIEVEMDEITIGPTVTRYALKPAEGVKLSR